MASSLFYSLVEMQAMWTRPLFTMWLQKQAGLEVWVLYPCTGPEEPLLAWAAELGGGCCWCCGEAQRSAR